MAQLSIANSIPAKLEDLLGSSIDTTTPRIDGFYRAQVTTANPADTTAAANSSALNTATATLTGAAVGDIVVGWGVVSGLATNQFVVAVYVSATDTVTALIGNLVNSTVTTTAVVLNVIVASVAA